MPRGLAAFIVKRVLLALVMVALVSSAALCLIAAAPGGELADFNLDSATLAAERERLGLDRPFLIQYADWLSRAVRLDFGQSIKYRRPVQELLAERAWNTGLLGAAALLLATLIGIPAGIVTGSSSGLLVSIARGVSMVLVSIPPLVTSFLLLFVAAQTRWFPIGGFGALSGGDAPAELLRYLVLPSLALALPMSAALEQLQAQAMRDALTEPSVRAALARGCSAARVIWRHAGRLSLKPVVALYGVFVGSLLSGSFAVEIVMSWPGLGALMFEALVARDLYLVAGCAAAGAAFLAGGVLASDVALLLVDPRVAEAA